jgi:hypothetical protein
VESSTQHEAAHEQGSGEGRSRKGKRQNLGRREQGMNTSHVREFQYQRNQGLRRIYKVTLNVTRLPSGICAYESWVHHEGIFKGKGIVLPLVSANFDDAVLEARRLIENDIEQLSGISE